MIEEAWARRRRRRRRLGAALVGAGAAASAAAAGLLAASHAGTAPPRAPVSAPAPISASPAAIRAFVARAQAALEGRYTVTYEVSLPGRHGAVRARVTAAQLSRGWSGYRETPPFSAAARDRSYEVLAGRAGLFSCELGGPARSWSCTGPYRGIGMGDTASLLGPDPLSALALGLGNAAAIYTGSAATRPEPAFFARRSVAGRAVRCLEFGRPAAPIGSVCLNALGLIADYSLPALPGAYYATATLRSYSNDVPRSLLSLPAPPTPYGT